MQVDMKLLWPQVAAVHQSMDDLTKKLSAWMRPFQFPLVRVMAVGMLVAAVLVPHATARPIWEGENTVFATDPENRRGGNPSYVNAPWNPNLGTTGGRLEDDGGALSGNYRLSIPLVSFPGRGQDMHLGINYSSQLWSQVMDPTNTSQTTLVFDPDSDWPSPGWSIGFGRILTSGTGVLIGPDNSRQALHAMNPIGGRIRHLGILGDSLSHIEICCFGVDADQGKTATLTDGRGRVVKYFTTTPGDRNAIYYPRTLVDANGNYLSVRYVRDSAGQEAPPAIDRIIDTVGRRVQFHYDTARRLVAISAPGLNRRGRRVYARFLYMDRDVQVEVGASCKPHSSRFDGIYGVVLPGTNTAHWIPASSGYGISTWTYETRGVQIKAPSLDTEATLLTQGEETRRTMFEYPNPASTTCIAKPPAYTSKTEEWDDPISGDKKASKTSYARADNDDDSVIAVTQPDGSVSTQRFARRTDPAKSTVAGQVRRIENADRAGRVLSSTDFEWERDVPNSYGAVRQRAVVENIDPLSRGKRTKFSYDPKLPSLVVGEMHYGYHDVSTTADIEWFGETRYLRDPAYLEAGLLALPQMVLRFVGNRFDVVSRADFEYDNAPLKPVGPLRQHLAGYEPRTEKKCVRYETDTSTGRPKRVCVEYKNVPAAVVTARGNLTRITRFADAAAGASPVSTSFRYDTTGNLVKSFDDTGRGTELTYDRESFYSLPATVVHGSTDAQSPIRVMSSFTHYLGAGLLRSTKDPDGRVTQYAYSRGPADWRLERTVLPGNTKQHTKYEDDRMTVRSHIEDASGKVYAPASFEFDGRGQLRRKAWRELVSDTVDNLSLTEYDLMGRLTGQSRPYKAHLPNQPHEAEKPVWTQREYDALGRLSSLKSNGEASMVFAHDEPRAPPAGVAMFPLQGSTLRTTDAWGRQKWMQRDASGNLKYLVEPNPENPTDIFAQGSLLTEYRHDPFGKLQAITMGPQTRRFVYDGLGRMTAQALPERNASLDAAGVYQGTGSAEKYTDVFVYDTRSNLVRSVDARGVRTVYEYQGDALNRLHEIRYELGARVDPSSDILPAAKVILSYPVVGDLRRPASLEVPGVVTHTVVPDALGRPKDLTTRLASYPSSPFTFTLGYDSIGRPNALTYPKRYGSGDAQRKLELGYDPGDTLLRLKLDAGVLAKNLTFFADGRNKALTLVTGAGEINESFGNDPVLGLPSSQTAVHANGERLLALEYRYRRQDLDLSGRTERPGIVGSITAVRDLLNGDLTQDFSYDGLGRLKGASAGDAMLAVFDPLKVSWQQYSYDRFGNRTQVHAFRQLVGRNPCPAFSCGTVDLDQEDHDGVSSLVYDAATNRITSAGYAYDAAGNLIRGQTWINGAYEPRAYQYDAAGRLVQVRAGSNGPLVETYKYGPDNRRLAASPDGTYWDYFAWVGNRNLAKFAAPSTLANPVWAEDSFYFGERHIATERAENNGVIALHHLADQRGTRLTIASKSGTVMFDRQGGRPFGTESAPSQEWLNTRRFTSYDRAGPTGLDNAVNRQYSAALGRFLQTDPIGGSAFDVSNPQTFNSYVRVTNNPVNFTDPAGTLPPAPAGCEWLEFEDGPALYCPDDVTTVIGSPLTESPATHDTGVSPGSRGVGRGAPVAEAKQECLAKLAAGMNSRIAATRDAAWLSAAQVGAVPALAFKPFGEFFKSPVVSAFLDGLAPDFARAGGSTALLGASEVAGSGGFGAVAVEAAAYYGSFVWTVSAAQAAATFLFQYGDPQTASAVINSRENIEAVLSNSIRGGPCDRL